MKTLVVRLYDNMGMTEIDYFLHSGTTRFDPTKETPIHHNKFNPNIKYFKSLRTKITECLEVNNLATEDFNSNFKKVSNNMFIVTNVNHKW